MLYIPSAPSTGAAVGTVTSVTSADANATVATTTTTPVITIVSAPKLATPRAINGVNFDGTAPITVADATKVPTTTTVNGHALSGNVTVTATDLTLGNVDNTSDANKPVSTATQTALNLKQDTTGKDATGGYAGLTLFKINFKNAANTFTNFLTNATTAARTYTFPDKDITVAGLADITGTNSGTNTGDQTISITGDVTASGSTGALTASVTKINGTALSGLATGILKNTTTTGVPSIAVAGDFPTLNQNTSGTASNLSGTPALPNGTTATTQTASDNSTKLATTAYVDGKPAGITWSAVTADGNLVINTGTLANKGTLLTLTLPTTAAVGSVIRVGGMNSGLWKIAQNASGIIHFGNQNTTTGTGGYLASVLTYDAVELICVVANNEWSVVSSVGNITVN